MFLAELNISIFPVGVLALLLINNRKHTGATWAQKLFNALTAFALCAIAANILRAWLIQFSAEGLRASAWTMCVLSCLICSAIPAAWLMYVYARIYGDEELKRDRLGVFIMVLPAIAGIVIALTTPFADFAFYFDTNDILSEGNGFIAVCIMSLLVTAFSLTITVVEAIRASSLERRRVCLLLAALSIIQLVCQAVDAFLHGGWTVHLVYAGELVILFINIQNTIITSDSLTGLNNRAEFNKYLDMLTSHRENGRGFYLFIMDIDCFKAINDKYGHSAGDEALRRMADILRETFGLSNAFFSRIGGDEFAMIINMDADAAQIMAKLNQALEKSDERAGSEYVLSVSIGYSVSKGDSSKTSGELFKEADESMYAHKRLRGGVSA